MAQVALNADLYAAPRQNIYFKGVVPSLDGQCVSLVKWFMQEMSGVPNPQAARGDARYVGKTLVAQGHAVEVPYSQRKRGDIICYEQGVYGHISVQLSGGRVFEQNVNMGGVSSKIVSGDRVYASRIGSENESWRASRNPHIYRLKTYKEEGVMSSFSEDQIRNLATKAGINQTPAQIKDGATKPAYEVALNFILTLRNRKDAEYRALLTSAQAIADVVGVAHDADHVDQKAVLEATKKLKASAGTGDPKAAALAAAVRDIMNP